MSLLTNTPVAITVALPPTPEEFYITYPLYQEFDFVKGQESKGWKIKYFSGTIDAYCPDCGCHSIFSHSPKQTSYGDDVWIIDHLFEVTLVCSRVKKHQLYFLFQVNGRTMQKIGQFPSLATLNMFDVRSYSSVLNKETFRELTKAIGLAAHGVGIGSFVYLRRIFENLVEEAHKAALVSASWDEDAYSRSRMGEKILQLEHLLPKFLVENRQMYGILSKGIHELTETECLAAFPVVKLGIEIILDAKIRSLEQQKKLTKAALAIQQLAK
jgi:hypothetical protein